MWHAAVALAVTMSEAVTILVVDDDIPIRAVLVSVLTEAGYTVLEAIHGVHALQLLATTSVDLVISDVMMPLLGGITLCQRVKQMGPIAVILMSSAPPQVPTGAGEDAFIVKPFDLDAVEQLIATVLHQKTYGDGEDRPH